MPTIDLPAQKIDWLSIDQNKLRKIFFQFEISQSDGRPEISLVAYPAYKDGPNWETRRVELPVISTEPTVTLNLPLTFGNIELNRPDIVKINNNGKSEFILRPHTFTQNPHASYELFDGATSLVKANPSPPAEPG